MKKLIKIKTIGLLVLSLVFTLWSVSCRRASEKTSEKLMEKLIENSTGNKADIDLSNEKAVIKTDAGSIEVDSNAKSWPDGIPDEVPEFTFGKVTAVTTTKMDDYQGWNVIFDEVGEGFIDKYDAKLKEKGFETVSMKVGDKGGSISAESGKFSILLMGDDEGKISLVVSAKKQE